MSDNLSDTPTRRGVPGRDPQQYLDGSTRSLDWRFSRVQALLTPRWGRPARPTPQDDEFVRQMREYLLLDRSSTPIAHQRLGLRFPGPSGALQIRNHVTRDLQLSVQCRILARQTDPQIARQTALPPIAIHWFEKLFFHVRDLLDSPDWVSANVLAEGCLEELSPLEGSLKRAAYMFGDDVFDTLHTGLPKRDDLDAPADFEADLEQAALGAVQRRILLVALNPAHMAPADLAVLVRLVQAFAAHKRELQGEAGERENQVEEAVRHTLGAIQFIKGDMAVEWLQKHNPNLLEFDSDAVELRDSQVYAAISGNVAQLAHLKDRKMPPPPPVRREAAPVPNDFDPLYDNAGPA